MDTPETDPDVKPSSGGIFFAQCHARYNGSLSLLLPMPSRYTPQPSQGTPSPTFSDPDTPTPPFERIAMNFIGPLRWSAKRFDYMLIIKDYTTGGSTLEGHAGSGGNTSSAMLLFL